MMHDHINKDQNHALHHVEGWVSLNRCVTMMISVCLIALTGCQKLPISPLSLSFEFSSCLGSIEESQSCSSQIFSTLVQSQIGCWIISSTDSSPELMSDQTTYHALMSWDGSDMRPSTALLAEDFPLSSDDVVSMNLFIFAAPISAEFCQGLTPQSSCGDFPNCRASIQRRDFSLIAGQSMSFRDDQLQQMHGPLFQRSVLINQTKTSNFRL